MEDGRWKMANSRCWMLDAGGRFGLNTEPLRSFDRCLLMLSPDSRIHLLAFSLRPLLAPTDDVVFVGVLDGALVFVDETVRTGGPGDDRLVHLVPGRIVYLHGNHAKQASRGITRIG